MSAYEWTPTEVYTLAFTVNPIFGFGLIQTEFDIGNRIETHWSLLLGFINITFFVRRKRVISSNNPSTINKENTNGT